MHIRLTWRVNGLNLESKGTEWLNGLKNKPALHLKEPGKEQTKPKLEEVRKQDQSRNKLKRDFFKNREKITELCWFFEKANTDKPQQH